MTSGRFTSIPVDTVTVERASRQRRELVGIEDLAASIATRGLINPIVVTQDHVLVAGECRLTAVRSLGWTHINAQYAEDLPPEELRLIELEENTKRRDLPWPDRCAATAEIHEIYRQRDPEWNQEKTAEVLGVNKTVVRDLLRVEKELRAPESVIAQAPSFSAALGLVERRAIRAKAALVESIMEEGNTDIPLHHADISEWLAAYEGPAFNFIHCDFPYGINFDKQKGMNSGNLDRYADSFDTYKNLIEEVLPRIPVTDQVHLMFWFSPIHFEYTKLTLIRQGWIVNPFPLLWVKSDNSGIMPDPKRGGRRTYETAFMASKGDRFVAQPVAMHWYGARGEATHASTKPREMLRHFFRMFVDSSTVMLDPTCGSGNAPRVAKDLGAIHVAGVEAIEEYWKDAVRLWNEA